jgi:excisionase family DNA binding protein|tara:strand:+ start:397 stop:570 length:174 start_codon:yes stop_codon:yes gene_type:complete
LNQKLLTIKDVSKQVGVTPQIVYEWVKRGDLKSIALSKRLIRIAPDELKKFLDERTN